MQANCRERSSHLLQHLLPDLPPQDDHYDRQQDGDDSHQAANQDPGVAVVHFVSGIVPCPTR